MPSDWTEVRLGDFISIKHGWPFKSVCFSAELTGRPIVVNIGNFQYTGGFRFESTTLKEYRGEYPPEYELRPGDTLLIMTCQTAAGEILGVPGRIPDDGRVYLHDQRMGKVEFKDETSKVDSDFLYSLFLWPEFNRHLFATASGTKILHTSPSRIEAFKFRIPPIGEQRAIGSLLRALDDEIELNRRMNDTLEAMARALFKSWFVDFDPVRAKSEGRQPYGMDADTAALFPDSFQDSALGKIPKGWQVSRLGEIAENLRRGVHPEEAPAGTPYIGLEHMPRKSITLANWSRSEEVASNKFAFRQGEILFGKLRPYFHKVGVAPLDGVCSTDILVVMAKSAKWYGLVLGHVSSEDFVNYADAVSTGTKMPRTNWQDMARYEICLPDSGLADVLGRFVRTVVEKIRQNILQSHTLAAIRDALLPKLISGEIRVQDAHKSQEARL